MLTLTLTPEYRLVRNVLINDILIIHIYLCFLLKLHFTLV